MRLRYQRPAVHHDALPPHRSELASPEKVPSRVMPGMWNAGVEAYVGQFPALFRTNRLIAYFTLGAGAIAAISMLMLGLTSLTGNAVG